MNSCLLVLLVNVLIRGKLSCVHVAGIYNWERGLVPRKGKMSIGVHVYCILSEQALHMLQ